MNAKRAACGLVPILGILAAGCARQPAPPPAESPPPVASSPEAAPQSANP